MLRTVRTRRVSRSAVRDDRGIRVVAGVLHAQRLEDVFLQEILVGLSADFLDQVARQRVARIVVLPIFSGMKLQGLVSEARDEFFRGRGYRLGGGIVRERS